MAIEINDPNRELGEKVAYVMVDGVQYAIVRADHFESLTETAHLLSNPANAEALRESVAFFDQNFGSGNTLTATGDGGITGASVFLAGAPKHFAGGSTEMAVAIIESAIKAAPAGYETVHKATKHAIEIAESNFHSSAAKKKLRAGMAGHSTASAIGKRHKPNN